MNEEHIAALEHIAEELLPLLINASPAKPAAIALLESWANRETSDGTEVALGNIADEILTRLS